MGVPTRIFVVLMTETKKLVVDTVLVREAHTVVGVLLLIPVPAQVPIQVSHNTQFSTKNVWSMH